ncbi:PREDICTED: LOW QUALITY PROTEIN: mucosal addressin cell adhesion molecule 1 [Galeopterus variegatus]|uniref:LOW QUALITY PROTEIN: mucosal addressin cell adhesion molecule 1 n=1 Tax=Galeopterus variegatus TaxID=482537 RepID=A0ABM0RQ16_GALVR|nr:PREDICTED: LOW QUALITY PROTEIN: mucosal addressin cell adhesion molecule 1 [Galeopterus variegatus]
MGLRTMGTDAAPHLPTRGSQAPIRLRGGESSSEMGRLSQLGLKAQRPSPQGDPSPREPPSPETFAGPPGHPRVGGQGGKAPRETPGEQLEEGAEEQGHRAVGRSPGRHYLSRVSHRPRDCRDDMAQGLALLLALSLGLLQPGHGQPLQLEPPEPEVAVAVGTSLQFTCSLACAGRGVASVRWRGLDTSLGAVQTGAGSSALTVSALTVHNASLAAAGTRVCVGSCGNVTFQRTVRLLVYAFPDQLTVSPAALVPGWDQEVACTAHNVTPAGPDALSFSLLLWGRELEGVQVLSRQEDEEPQEDEDVLYRVTEHWLLPRLGTPAPPALHCQATMRLPRLELTHRRAIPILPRQTSPEPPVTTSPDPPVTTSSEPPVTTSLETSPQQDTTHGIRSPGSTRTCWPEIHQAGPMWRGVVPKSTPSPVAVQLPAALWASSLALGLLLLVFLAYHLRKRCQSRAEDRTRPPAPEAPILVSAWARLRGTGRSPS